VRAERGDDRPGITDMPVHPRSERLDAEQNRRGARGRQRRAEIAQSLDPGAYDEGGGSVVVGEIEAMIAVVRLDQRLVPLRPAPIETPGVNEDADHPPVAADPLGERMHDAMSAPNSIGRQHLSHSVSGKVVVLNVNNTILIDNIMLTSRASAAPWNRRHSAAFAKRTSPTRRGVRGIGQARGPHVGRRVRLNILTVGRWRES
jgi:hypothetical protein